MSTNKSILKSAGIISFATLCSRLLGFVRDAAIARLFGIYVYAQAFVVAFRIPNLFRDLVGEGASNAALIPVFSEYIAKHTKEEFWELVNVLLNLLLVILMAITICGIALSPLIVRFIAPGFIGSPHKLEVTIRLTRIIFPYILLISLAAYSMSILNSLKHFSIPAFAPCLLNISIIVCTIFFGEGITGLASGVLLGGVLQLLVQIPILYKKGFRLMLFRHFKHPAAKMIGLLMLPRLFSTCIYHLNNFVDSIFGSLASIVGEGGVAVLYFAYRLIQFPLGIFSNALSQAILPTLSTQAVEDNREKIKQTLSFGLRSIFFVMIPTSVVFMVLSQVIVSTLFGGGRFDIKSIDLTAGALSFYSIGLCAYAANKILQSYFFALKDTSTPAKISVVSLILNIALNYAFMYPLKLKGLALATSVSAIVTFLILFLITARKLGSFSTKEIIFSFWRILMASICMGVTCLWLSRNNVVPGYSFLCRLINLGWAMCISLVSYIAFCFIFRVSEMKGLWFWLIQKKICMMQRN